MLREQAARPAGAPGFRIEGQEPACGSERQWQPAEPGHWREADVLRAIAAAEKAGLAGYRIEIATDGTIAIVVTGTGTGTGTSTGTDTGTGG